VHNEVSFVVMYMCLIAQQGSYQVFSETFTFHVQNVDLILTCFPSW